MKKKPQHDNRVPKTIFSIACTQENEILLVCIINVKTVASIRFKVIRECLHCSFLELVITRSYRTKYTTMLILQPPKWIVAKWGSRNRPKHIYMKENTRNENRVKRIIQHKVKQMIVSFLSHGLKKMQSSESLNQHQTVATKLRNCPWVLGCSF